MPKLIDPPAWQERTIAVQVRQDGAWAAQQVTAFCRGPLAVHAGVKDPALYTVTAVASGLGVCKFAALDDAIAFASLLFLQEWVGAFGLPTRREVMAALPAWTHGWLNECYLRRKLLPLPKEGR